MTAPPYRLVVLGSSTEWVEEVIARCRQALIDVVGRPASVAIERVLADSPDPAESPPQTAVMFLADERSRDDPRLVAQLESARAEFIPVLPVVRPTADVFAVLPQIVRPLNAVPWERDGARVCTQVLRLLGLVERERKLFLSYRRNETSGLALQLRTHLCQRSFDVFLDRFSVPPAADFQRRIDIELADKAFILLLESASAIGSEWVQHEVAYALSHGISLLALLLPNTPVDQRFPAVDPAFRLPLSPADLEPADDADGSSNPVLKKDCREAVLDAVEDRYARQLRRRRAELMGSLADWLRRAGGVPETLENEWAMTATCPGIDVSVFLVTPRAPKPEDLRELDALRQARGEALGASVEGHLVHAAPVLEDESRRLIEWIVESRPLHTHSHLQVPDLLGLP